MQWLPGKFHRGQMDIFCLRRELKKANLIQLLCGQLQFVLANLEISLEMLKTMPDGDIRNSSKSTCTRRFKADTSSSAPERAFSFSSSFCEVVVNSSIALSSSTFKIFHHTSGACSSSPPAAEISSLVRPLLPKPCQHEDEQLLKPKIMMVMRINRDEILPAIETCSSSRCPLPAHTHQPCLRRRPSPPWKIMIEKKEKPSPPIES